MRRPSGTAMLAVALAGCGDRTEQAQSSAPSAATPAASRRQIGTSSTLHADTSPLAGTVTGFAVSITDTATEVSLAADTLFAFDSATVTAAAGENLARTADLARRGGKGEVRVIGHTDAKGDDAYNLALSRRRAEAVAAWLRAQPGLADRRFVAEGRGETEPVAADTKPDGNDDTAGRARNRRVLVSIPR